MLIIIIAVILGSARGRAGYCNGVHLYMAI